MIAKKSKCEGKMEWLRSRFKLDSFGGVSFLWMEVSHYFGILTTRSKSFPSCPSDQLEAFKNLSNVKSIIIYKQFSNLLALDDNHVSNFTDTTYENAFYPVINKSTRITDTTATLLDQLWTYLPPHQSTVYVLIDQVSDHLPVLSCSHSEKIFLTKNANKPKRRSFSKHNQAKFQQKLQNVNLSHIVQSEDLNTTYDIFKQEFDVIFNESFPFVSVTQNSFKNDWYDNELKQLLIKKEVLFKKYVVKKDGHKQD